jgi:hypothetical protein
LQSKIFKGATEAEVKQQVEAWVQRNFLIAVAALKKAFKAPMEAGDGE